MASRNPRRGARAFMLALAASTAKGGFAQDGAAPKKLELSRSSSGAVGLFEKYCLACHDWAADRKAILDSGYVLPGDVEASFALVMVEAGLMPPSGAKPTEAELQAIRDWIAAGATEPEAEWNGETDAVSAPTE